MPARGPVVAIGECLVDLIAPQGVTLDTAPSLSIREGGAPANVAVGMARLGVPSQLRCVVGDDPFGARLRAVLDANGVDTTRVRTADDEPTTLALAWSDERGDGRFRLIRLADRLLSPADVSRDSLVGAEAIVVGSVALCAEPSRDAVLTAIRHAGEAGIPVVADLNIRPGQIPIDELRLLATALITSATVVKVSVGDADELWGASSITETASAMTRFGERIVVITDGARGAALIVGDQFVELPAFAVDAIEPTGAGDAFTAAFISRMIARNWQDPQASDLRFAMAAGAIATSQPGAIDALPTREAIEAFLAERGHDADTS